MRRGVLLPATDCYVKCQTPGLSDTSIKRTRGWRVHGSATPPSKYRRVRTRIRYFRCYFTHRLAVHDWLFWLRACEQSSCVCCEPAAVVAVGYRCAIAVAFPTLLEPPTGPGRTESDASANQTRQCGWHQVLPRIPAPARLCVCGSEACDTIIISSLGRCCATGMGYTIPKISPSTPLARKPRLTHTRFPRGQTLVTGKDIAQ